MAVRIGNGGGFWGDSQDAPVELVGEPLKLAAGDCMNRDPKTIAPGALATNALAKMEENRITSIIVVDERLYVLGVVHIHDLWRLQMF